jgi:putative ABC transport system permease protein
MQMGITGESELFHKLFVTLYTAKQTRLTLIVLILIAVGLGGCTAVLSVALKALQPPVEEPQSLWWLEPPASSRADGFNPQQIENLRVAGEPIQAVGGYVPPSRRGQLDFLTIGGRRLPVSTTQTTASLFSMLGDGFALGRGFSAEESNFQYNFFHAVIISWDLWRQRFNGDPSIIGKTIDFHGSPFPNGIALTVVGVMDRKAIFLDTTLSLR